MVQTLSFMLIYWETVLNLDQTADSSNIKTQIHNFLFLDYIILFYFILLLLYCVAELQQVVDESIIKINW